MEIKVGQMVEITYREDGKNASWDYAVAVKVFDDRVEFIKDSGVRFMHVISSGSGEKKLIDNQPTKMVLTPLYKGGKPVFSKRNIFGQYTFKPKK